MMKRNALMGMVMGAGLMLGAVLAVQAAGNAVPVGAARDALARASAAIDQARSAIDQAKQTLARIPSDSPMMDEITRMLAETSRRWDAAIAALSDAQRSASRIPQASNPQIAKDYERLASSSAAVALAGAEAVQTSIAFINAVAANQSQESLDIIRMTVQNALNAADEALAGYERVKALIARKYSK